MELTEKEVKDLNQKRAGAASKARAEAFLARKEAEETKGWYWFLRNHMGQRGLTNGDFIDCEANRQLMTGWLATNQLPVNQQSLEKAYQANKAQLAKRPTQEYRRVTDTQQTRVFPQIRSLEPKAPPAYAPWTREEILSWSPQRLAKEMRKNLDGINKILAGQN